MTVKRYIKSILNSLVRLIHPNRKNIIIGADTEVELWKISTQHGKLIIGANSLVQCRIDFDAPQAIVRIGDRTFIGSSHIVCCSGIDIGDDVLISWGVTVVDHNSHSLDWKHRQKDVLLWRKGEKKWHGVKVAPVKICDRAWIGFGALILKGVTIGEGAIVAAGAVVTHDIPPYAVFGGNPAKFIRELSDDER